VSGVARHARGALVAALFASTACALVVALAGHGDAACAAEAVATTAMAAFILMMGLTQRLPRC
jgi:hypothetical protein